MRKNLPVTDTQYHTEDCKPIVSKTDLKGKITYGNPDRIVFREEQVVRSGLTGIFSALYDLPISVLITLGILTLCALYLVLGVLGFATSSGSAAWGFAGGDLTSTIETQHGGDMSQLLRVLQQMNVKSVRA